MFSFNRVYSAHEVGLNNLSLVFRGNHSDVVKMLLEQNLNLENLNCELLVKSSSQGNTHYEEDMIIKVPIPQSKEHGSWIISKIQDEYIISQASGTREIKSENVFCSKARAAAQDLLSLFK